MRRKFPIGAERLGNAVAFRVWAPARTRVAVVYEGESGSYEHAPERDGYYSATLDTAPGTLYRLRLDGGACYPDPASRFQPQGHEGPSQIVDPDAYEWRDADWRGLGRAGHVIYEMHVGTFTPEGTWRAAAAALPWLAELGVTVLELMPIGEFPGVFGWGYDVVHFFAPTHLYGSPDDRRAFVDTAHALGMGVILDVVYNHCATVGCFLAQFGSGYFSRRYRSDWGHALNFDDADAQPVRDYFTANAEYWIREFHLDGFRLDATQTIFDSSPTHILTEISARARSAAGSRGILLVAENEPQHVKLLQGAEDGGAGVDALWNDDFHHTARVRLTGRSEAYYMDYGGTPQEFVSAAKHGFLYQGQYYAWQKKRRGTPTLGFDATRFVHYLQNHDQVANSTRGLRLHELTSPGLFRAGTALLLLMPQTPLLFQGQEFAASTPFLYFADNDPEHAEIVKQGRREFLSQFQSIAAGGHALLVDPAQREAFERSKLRLEERATHAHAVALHRDLIRLRRSDPVFAAQRSDAIEGAVLPGEAFVLRYFGQDDGDRLLIVNLGREVVLNRCPQPLLAPPAGGDWQLIWSSEDVVYGGDGTAPPLCDEVWHLPAHSALVFSGRSAASGLPALPGKAQHI